MIDARQIDADSDARRIAEAIRLAAAARDKRVLLRGAWNVGAEAAKNNALIYLGPDAAGVALCGDETTTISPTVDGSENYFFVGLFNTSEVSLERLNMDGKGIAKINAVYSEGVKECRASNLRVEHFGRSGFYLDGDWTGEQIVSRLNSQESLGHHGMAIVGGKHRWRKVYSIANATGADIWASVHGTDVEFVDSRFSANYYNNLKWGNSPDDRQKTGRVIVRRSVLSNALMGNGFTNSFQAVKPDVSTLLDGCTIENNDIGAKGHDRFEIIGCTVRNNRIGIFAKTMSGCSVEGGEYGIYLEGAGATIVGCKVSKAKYGLHGLWASEAVLRRCTIVDNVNRDIFAKDLTISESVLGYVDAENGRIKVRDSKIARAKGKVEIENASTDNGHG